MSLSNSILSLNVRGLREAKKRREIFQWLKQYHKGKDSIIFLQETHSTALDLTSWERDWGSKVIMSHGTSNSRGVAILLPINYNFEIQNSTVSTDGRKITLNILCDEIEYCLINVYAPTQDLENEQIQFINYLRLDIEQNIEKKLIIGGDFNIPLENIDKSNGTVNNSKSRIQMNQLLDTYHLIDIWRVLNPDEKRFTWRRRKPILTQSRLDYWIIGADLSYYISHCDIKPSIKTDHSLITIEFTKITSSKRGSGLWKFSSHLLSDIDFVGYMRGIIAMHCNLLKNMTNKSLKWEIVKMELRNATVSYSKTQAFYTKEYENQLSKEFQNLAETLEKKRSLELENRYLLIKQEIEKLNAIKTEGLRIRAKATVIEYNERGSKYFTSLEKRNANLKNITKLKTAEHEEITEKDQILNELAAFYKELYSSKEYCNDYEKCFFTNDIPRLTDNDQLICDSDISLNECFAALKKMKVNKSPGTDGLTVEFYQYFWEDLKVLVHESIQSAFENKILSNDQKRGILRLIPKKSKDLTNIKNWRPISLLNTDYKLIAHILSNRLQKVLPKIISNDQSGYLKGRNISLNIRSIFDIIDFVEKDNSSGLLAFLDFEKAFDKLNWTFLQKALSKFGFGPKFKEWVTILYTNIESCIINNGQTSKYFEIKSGIRQGCPLSALLFVIAVEVLSLSIKKNDLIKGFKIGNGMFKITQLADDTTLFLRDINSLKEALSLLDWFKNISGLKLNETKTEILQIGVPLTTNYSLFKLKWEKERIYALGTWFYKDYNASINATYVNRLQMIEDLVKLWSMRNLTWLGKITVIKTMCISKIIYSITSIEPPHWFIQQIKSIFENFLWSNKPPRVKNNIMYNDYELGGLRMPNMKHFIKAQNINWIKRLLENTQSLPYAYVSSFIKMSLDDYLKSNIGQNGLPSEMPIFYKNILADWFSLKEEPKTASDVQREVLWNNQHIKIGNKSLFNKTLYNNGLVYINDILNVEGKLLSYDEVTDKFGKHITLYYYTCLKDAIPKKWRKILVNSNLLDLNPANEALFVNFNKYSKPVKIVKSKTIYWLLNTVTVTVPSCINAWFEKYFIEFSDIKWKYIFTMANSITMNTKLIEFQFKIIHRVYASDSYVSNFDNTVSKTCNQCQVDNNIPHLFVDCIKVIPFWRQLNAWLKEIDVGLPIFSTADIIFGIPKKVSFMPNFCILHAKWFIHLHKADDQNIFFNQFLLYLQNVLTIEHQIAVNMKNTLLFKKHLQVLSDAIP